MGKLDVKLLRFMSKEEFRVLTACEMGMRNHDIVPTTLISSISNLKRGGAFKIIRVLLRNKLVSHFSIPYDGYRLTYKGYDYLALKALSTRGSIKAVGSQFGVGKESDVYLVTDENDRELVLKIHRLGRICFRAVKQKRDYLEHRRSAANWLYLSRLACEKEYAYMEVLHKHNFRIPEPIDHCRHCLLMTRAEGYPLMQIKRIRHPDLVFHRLMEIMIRLAEYGLIHCDFNEFNLIINEEEVPTLIDFPQMVSVTHVNGEQLFNRDVLTLIAHFKRKFGFEPATYPTFKKDVKQGEVSLDDDLRASGWNEAQQSLLAQSLSEQQEELRMAGTVDITQLDADGEELPPDEARVDDDLEDGVEEGGEEEGENEEDDEGEQDEELVTAMEELFHRGGVDRTAGGLNRGQASEDENEDLLGRMDDEYGQSRGVGGLNDISDDDEAVEGTVWKPSAARQEMRDDMNDRKAEARAKRAPKAEGYKQKNKVMSPEDVKRKVAGKVKHQRKDQGQNHTRKRNSAKAARNRMANRDTKEAMF